VIDDTDVPSGAGQECRMCQNGNVANKPDETQCADEGTPACTIDKCTSGQCMHVTIPEIPPFTPDPYGIDINGLTPATQNALQCLQNAVTNVGGNLIVTSAFRPQAYQDHLREVWNRKQLLGNWNEVECTPIRDEINRHGIAFQPAAISNHTAGTAFDANWTLPLSNDIDVLANGCSLTRCVPGDHVHFCR